ncbi:uncharacterized protein K02A2.6-like [Saccostrea echinata]|uniref:uncharacterized protein K02A2.6-like n=1 Tax=Saccostrea echinata TaxID=191078 RepID=UPI002A82ECA9|nr:uncharacterized protein K02A2.6-like [Saccostrea echinata]
MPEENEQVKTAPAAVQNLHVFPMNIPFPKPLDLKDDLATNWKHFKRVWENYEIATGLRERDTQLRCATFLTCLGSDGLHVVDGLKVDTDDDKKDIDKVITALDTYCVGQTNVIYERYTFNCRNQEQSEHIDAYVAELRTLAKICKFGDMEDEMIRDRNVHHVKVKQKVKQDNHGKNEKRRDNRTQTIPTVQSCRYCGRTHPRSREKCPAFGQTCNLCGEQNHFERKCPNKEPPIAKHHEKRRGTWNRRKSQVHEIETRESDSSDELVLSIEQVHSLSSKRHTAVMNIHDKYVEFQLDNGSTANILSAHVYVRLTGDKELQNLKKSDVTLQMYNKSETKALGTIRMSVRNPCNGKKYNLEFVIVPGKELHCILGKRAIEGIELITVHTDKFLTKTQVQNDVISQIDIKEEINEKYANVFKDLGKLDGKLHLEVKDSVRPVQLPPRKIPLALKPKVKEELNRLEKLGVIKPVNTPTDWVSALVVAPKRNGDIRLCIDPKPLNEALMRNHYPTPTIEDIRPELH